LHATNTFLNKTAVQGITILEISKENLKVNPQEYSVPKSQTNPEKPTQEFSKRWFVFLMLLIIAAIAIYFSEKLKIFQIFLIKNIEFNHLQFLR
jgi:hypothetical protein